MRTPDQDVADGLRLARAPEYCEIEFADRLCIGQYQGRLELEFDTDSDYGYVTVASLSPDEAESLARVLQAWAGYRRGKTRPNTAADPWREET